MKKIKMKQIWQPQKEADTHSEMENTLRKVVPKKISGASWLIKLVLAGSVILSGCSLNSRQAGNHQSQESEISLAEKEFVSPVTVDKGSSLVDLNLSTLCQGETTLTCCHQGVHFTQEEQNTEGLVKSSEESKAGQQKEYVTFTNDALIQTKSPKLLVEVPAVAEADLVPLFDPEKPNDLGIYDLRYQDVSGMNLSGIQNDMNKTWISSSTTLPDAFLSKEDWELIWKYGKNPGLGIAELHERGITGKGVSIAIIDRPVQNEHEEYKDNLALSEAIHQSVEQNRIFASMHGSAVCSLAAGKTTGAAPDSSIYFLTTSFGHVQENGEEEFDGAVLAACIDRVLELNQILDEKDRIRVISASVGWMPDDKNVDILLESIEQAKEEGILVLTTSVADYYPDFHLFGAERDLRKDPDDPDSYELVSWIDPVQSKGSDFSTYYCAPISRAYASFASTDGYELMKSGGLSWAVPWFAGLYALACQNNPDISPELFLEAIQKTSIPEEYGNLVQPAEVLNYIQTNV